MNLLGPQAVVTAGVLGALGLGMMRRPASTTARALSLFIPAAALFVLSKVAPAASAPLFLVDLKSIGWQAAIYIAALPFAFVAAANDVDAALYLGAILGMGLLAAAANLPMLFIGLEFMSIPAYLLVARRSAGAGLEAAVKYFFAGAFAGALFLLGMALFYAETGRLGFVAGPLGPQAQAGAALMAAAALFKIGAVPLHWWLPDVYESADPELAGFLSTSMKAAAVLMLVRLVQFAPGASFARALPAIGATTAMVGAALSLRQRGLRRLLAYSSLSHAGFMIMAVGAWAALGRDRAAAAAILFYVAAYAVLGNGAYSFVKAAGAETRASMRGFASRRPALSAAFAVILFSLAGIPPTGGFFAKLLVFWQLLRADAPLTAGVAAVSALISLVVYLGLVRDLYFEPLPKESSTLVPSGAAALVCGATALAALALGAAPALLTGPGGVFWR